MDAVDTGFIPVKRKARAIVDDVDYSTDLNADAVDKSDGEN
jgi:hypothetical protein